MAAQCSKRSRCHGSVLAPRNQPWATAHSRPQHCPLQGQASVQLQVLLPPLAARSFLFLQHLRSIGQWGGFMNARRHLHRGRTLPLQPSRHLVQQEHHRWGQLQQRAQVIDQPSQLPHQRARSSSILGSSRATRALLLLLFRMIAIVMQRLGPDHQGSASWRLVGHQFQPFRSRLARPMRMPRGSTRQPRPAGGMADGMVAWTTRQFVDQKQQCLSLTRWVRSSRILTPPWTYP